MELPTCFFNGFLEGDPEVLIHGLQSLEHLVKLCCGWLGNYVVKAMADRAPVGHVAGLCHPEARSGHADLPGACAVRNLGPQGALFVGALQGAAQNGERSPGTVTPPVALSTIGDQGLSDGIVLMENLSLKHI